MSSKLLLPVTLPLRVVALQLRLARAAAGIALDVTRGVAEHAPWAHGDAGERPMTATAPPVPEPSAPPPGPDPAEPVRTARRRAAVQRTRAERPPAQAPDSAARPRRTTGRKPPAAAAATPPADTEPPPKPRARRTARKATAAKPARQRASGPTRGEAAAIRAARRDAEAAGGGSGPGPEVRLEAPWPGYDEMRLDEVLDRLATAEEAVLVAVRLYEVQGENRQAILLATETP
jgi:hypothetical protein